MRRFPQYIEAAVGLGFRQSGHGSRGRTVGAGRRIQADGIRQSDGGRRIRPTGLGQSEGGRRIQADGFRAVGFKADGFRAVGVGSRGRQSGV
jgi:hypothetical protein